MIIFLNGSVNAGKSTVAKVLSQKVPNMAVVEVDALREMIEWMPLKESIPLNLENAVSVIRNFSKNNINVVVPYPLSQENYDYMINNLKDLNSEIYVFTLKPTLEKSLTNRGSRELTEWEKERIKYHYDSGLLDPSFGEIIDNSDLTPEQTAEIILSKIK